MKLPDPSNTVQALIDRHFETCAADLPRPHIGASALGHPCDRWLWLSFRWAVQERHPGRILRLFRRGQMEEPTLIADLRAIGLEVTTEGADGHQVRVDFGAHVSGSLDAIIESGVPESPKKRHVAEFKTHSKKSFDEMLKLGLEQAKPGHYVQMQTYMHGTGIDRGLYVAICKDDDRIYTERVRHSPEAAQRAIERGQRLALSDRLPPPISTDPSWYQCKFCPASAQICHESHITKHVNCRTCAHSTAKPDSTWRCERHDADGIPVEYQREGCECHVLHPDLVPWPRKDGLDQWIAVYVIDGQEVANGEGDANVYTSRELLAGESKGARDAA